MKYNFTIIIPHRNIPVLLERCLNSIPLRDDLNIIIIDDNSDPQIVNFNNFPGINRKNVDIIFTKEGKGAGYARNIGLEKANSKWILFADADDFYSEDLNEFLNSYQNTNFDVVFFKNYTIDNDTLKRVNKELMVEELYEECKLKGNFDPLKYKAHAPWTKLINKSLIDKYNLRYQEVIAANDVYFNVMVGHFAKKIDICNTIVYIRTIRQGSLFYSLKKENLLSRLKVGYKTNAFLKEISKNEYYVETWGYFLDLRKISWFTFILNIIPYLWNTPKKLLYKNIKYIIIKK